MSVDRPRPLVAGNWKMNGLKSSAKVLSEIQAGYTPGLKAKVELAVCPPATLIGMFAMMAVGSRVAIGGQDCHPKEMGAFTGDLSAEMLADAGATYAIVGHSERRQYHGEKDADVCAKALAAHRAGLTAIVCIGETRQEREAGRTLSVVKKQLRGSVPADSNSHNLVIAYEPVWAIGTGLTPTPADVAEVHALIRDELRRLVGKGEHAKVRILYGGSVKPSNAAELMAVANVDGALVGGASLVAADFLAIAGAYLG
ncbi:triose-phosphate isomerase [Microvirga thermotolerans]|uniref:Triosephosphate isomerase n=1 Tax=Microvirga thermotolerans TaxID=2651334 RepID=A0A5P9JYE7_9HYPH|nr:triose-phosphate isomerase [Microvirga thermotolerans]QFU16430.1 triose-phosphate isomerase [Microvirga thermotolerans]